MEFDGLLPSRRKAPPKADPVRDPPRTTMQHGGERRVGVEIKFGGLAASAAAETVAHATNGTCHALDGQCIRVEGGLIDQLDIRHDRPPASVLVHSPCPSGPAPGEPAGAGVMAGLGQAVAKAAYSQVAVVELVTPPMAYSRLQQLNLAIDALRRAGARNSAVLGLASFGTHINVEVATLDMDWLLRMVRAYALANIWLRERLVPGWPRRLAPYIDPWPLDYVDLITDPDYRPRQADLIGDYLAYNPTGNRDLDLLPLLSHLDDERVRTLIETVDLKSRPAFHFRLPNTGIEDDGWSPVMAWNLWVRVEHLAEDGDRLERLAERWRAYRRAWFTDLDWPETVRTELA